MLENIMSTLLFAKALLALQTEAFRFVVLFVVPIGCYAWLQGEAFKDLQGRWKLITLAPAVLMAAVVYVLAFDAVIALLLHHEPTENLFLVYLVTGAASLSFLCALLAGHKLMLARRATHRSHAPDRHLHG